MSYTKLKLDKIKKYNVLFITIMLITSGLLIMPINNADPLDPWFNNSWSYRKEIVIDHTQVSSDLADFPLLIEFDGDVDIRDHAQSDGDDFVFTDVVGSVIPYEIELYDGNVGDLVVWVNVPFISSSEDTSIYLYYGNDAVGSQQDVDGTWNSGYVGVWHFNDDSLMDSTVNGYGATSVDTNYVSDAMIAGGRSFVDTVGSRLDVENWAVLSDQFSAEMWLLRDTSDSSSFIRLFTEGDSWTSNDWCLYLRNDDDNIRFVMNNVDFETTPVGSYPISNGVWYHVAVTFDNGNVLVYKDGNLVASWTDNEFSGTLFNAFSTLTIGNEAGGGRPWIGSIDETRVSSVARSTDWIKLSYQNQLNPDSICSIGFEQHSVPKNQPPIIENELPINSEQNVDINIGFVSVKISDTDGDTFNWSIEGSYIENSYGYNEWDGTKNAVINGPIPYNTVVIWYVNATDGDGSKNATNKTYSFTTVDINTPTLKWVTNTEVGRCTVPVLAADVDLDGNVEVIKKGPNGITVLDGKTGNVKWTNLTPTYGEHGSMEIIDLNKDGFPEILVAELNGGLSAFHANNGTRYWHNPDAISSDKYLVAGDIDADGYPEIFTTIHGFPGRIFAMNYKGQIYAESDTGYSCWGGLSLADTNYDGVFELYQNDYSAYGLRSWNPYDLTLNWNQNMGGALTCESHCATLVDVNKDGKLDAVVIQQYKGTSSGIGVFDTDDGSVIRWTKNIPNFHGHSQPTIYDIDNDGNLELISAGGGRGHGVLSRPVIWDLYDWTAESGGVLDDYGRLPYECYEPPGVADLTGDGNVEIIQSNSNNVTIYNNKYEYLYTIPIQHAHAYTLAHDLDGDGKNELVIHADSYVYVYEIEGASPEPEANAQISFYSQHRGRSPKYTPYGPLAPIILDEKPVESSTNKIINHKLSVKIHQYQQNNVDIIFKTNASTGIWHEIDRFDNIPIGTYNVTPTDMDQLGTTYYWSVHVKDTYSGLWTNKTFSFTTQSESSALWWHEDWAYRKKIVVYQEFINDDLQDFPILVHIPNDENLSMYAQNDGDDIVFTDFNGNKLAHEIETFNDQTGELYCWVKIPFLLSTEDTKLYLYYGNVATSNQEQIADTWDDNFVMVQHMSDSGILQDSTLFDNDGTTIGTSLSSQGIISGCRQFDSTNSYLNFADAPELNPRNESYTISFWTKVPYVQQNLIRKNLGGSGYFMRLYHGWGGDNYFMVQDGSSSAYRYWNTEWDGSNWHLITIVINRDTNAIDLYYDGELDNGPGPANIEGLGDIITSDSIRVYGGSNGFLDELRISNTVRDPNWIKTSYLNQYNVNEFMIIGDNEESPIYDGEKPIISSISADPNSINESESLNIICDVTDNEYLKDVRINITSPIGISENISIIDNKINNTFYHSDHFDEIGNYTFRIWAEDNAGETWLNKSNNQNISDEYSFEVKEIIDETPPVIENIHIHPNIQIANEFVNISCEVYDESEINVVKINITNPLGEIENKSMTHYDYDSDSVVSVTYYLNASYETIGTYEFFIWVNDTNNNSNISNLLSFTIVEPPDTTPPEIANIQSYPMSQSIGGSVNISAMVTDNEAVRMVKVNITTPYGASANQSMIGSYYWNDTYTVAGTYTYFIWANDTSNNSNMSLMYSFDIINYPPIISTQSPQNNDYNIELNPTLEASITDLEEDIVSWSIQTNASGSWQELNSGILSTGSGDITATPTTMDQYNTRYYWRVNIGDGIQDISETYSFTTLPLLSEWNYRKQITIDHNMIDEPLTDFPVLINIENDADLIESAQNDFDDILFTNESTDWNADDVNARLSHEIESSDSTNGNLTVWVKIPYLSATTDTILYMYYGNLDSGNQEQPDTVWSNDFVMVQHLDETSGTHYDSTSFMNDGEARNDTNQDAIGMINGANDFDGVLDGTNQYVHVNDDDSLDLYENGTLSAWIKVDTFNTFAGVIHKGDLNDFSDESFGLQFWYSGDIKKIQLTIVNDANPDGVFVRATSDLSEDIWYHVLGTWNNTGRYLYINGIMNDSDSNVQYPRISTGGVNIGAQTIQEYNDGWGNFPFDGIIDEVRMSKTSRNSSWIHASYLNQLDPTSFATIGYQEPDNDPPIIDNIQAIPNPQDQYQPVNISCRVADAAITDVFVNIIYPDNSFMNQSILSNNIDSTYYYNTTYSIDGVYEYVIWAVDQSGNTATSPIQSFTINEYIDTEPPVITNVQATPNPQTSGGFVNITCTVTDNQEVNKANVSITGPAGFTPVNTSILAGYYNSSYSIIGTYMYLIWANDTNNNTITSTTYEFIIEALPDTEPPTITNVQAIPNTQTAGGIVNITATINDNEAVNLVKINITDPSGNMINETMLGSYYYEDTYIEIGTYTFYIYAEDTSGNSNVTTPDTFIIEEAGTTHPPTFSNIQPTNESIDVSLSPTLSVEVTDADGDLMICDFYVSTDGINWDHKLTITDVLNETITYDYTDANEIQTTYYWKITANDTEYNHSETFMFTTGLPESFDMAILADSTYYNYDGEYDLDRLARWHNENDTIETIVLDISDLSSNPKTWVTGPYGDANPANPFKRTDEDVVTNLAMFNDTQAQIRNYIRYLNYEHDVTYVLLAGNIDTIPMRYLFANSSGAPAFGDQYHDLVPTDMYYACLNGSFNEDEDENQAPANPDDHYGPYGGWGENLSENGNIDEAWWNYSVSIGRFPCKDTNGLSNMVQKTITYLNTPETDSYLQNVTLAGMGGGWEGNYWLAEYAKTLNGTYTWWDGEETIGFNPNEWNLNVLDSNPNRDEGKPFTDANSHDLFNQGTHVWYQASHGMVNGWHLSDGEGNDFLNEDILSLTNKDKPTLVLSCLPCLTADIEDTMDAFAVNFMEDDDGAFAGVFNTKYGWGSYNDASHGYDGLNASSHYIGSQIVDAWMTGTANRLGDMVYEAKKYAQNWQEPKPDLSIRWATYEQILFGDPAIQLKTYNPGNTPPQITTIDATPNPQNTGGNVNISCMVADNQAVDQVYVNITGPTGFTTINVSMNEIDTNSYYYEQAYSTLGDYTFVIWATDDQGLVSHSAENSFSIIEPATDLTEWEYRRTVTIDYSMIDESLTDFPVLIQINDDEDIVTYAQSDFDDILFTDQSISWTTGTENDKLAHEIESFDSTTGNLTVWVKIPQLSATTDTILYMYYGNPTSDNQQEPSSVWSDDFVMVQHLEETSGTIYDSTSNNHDGTPINNPNLDATGMINGADEFDGTDNSIEIPHHTDLNGVNGLTVSYWVYLDSNTTHSDVIHKGEMGKGWAFWYWPSDPGISGAPTEALGFGNQGTLKWIWTDSTLATGQWYHIVGTYNSTSPEQKMYVDGVLQAKTGNYDWDLSTTDILNIANGLDGYFDGIIDEVRISKTYRNSSWIQTSYLNQLNPSSFAEVSIVDTESPEITNIVSSPIEKYAGELVNITCTVSDNVEVTLVTVNITDPSGDMINETMLGSYYYENIFTELGEYSFHIYAVDSNANSVISSTQTFTILNSPPTSTSITPENLASNIVLNPVIEATIQDAQGDTIEWSIQSNCSGAWNILNSGTISGSGQISATSGDFIEYDTKYYWSINLTDPIGSNTWNNKTYSFTTMSASSWYDTNWMYREPIMVNTTEITETLDEFPIVIDITHVGLSDYAQNDGDDILFTTTTRLKLDHEIETFDKTTGHLVAWVKLPQITGNSMIYLYYGNPQSANQQNPNNVWSDDFVMVQHLNEDSGTHYDSTSFANDGEPRNNTNQNIDGMLNGANEFDGTNQYVHVNDDDSLDLYENGTLSAWIKVDTFNTFAGVIHKGDLNDFSDESFGLQFWYSGDIKKIQLTIVNDANPDGVFVRATSDLSEDIWYHVLGTWNNTGRYLYINGIMNDSDSNVQYPRISTGGVNIGAQTIQEYNDGWGNFPFDGIIDEVRMSKTSRNSSWIHASYLNQLNPALFLTTGSIEGGGTDTQPPYIQNLQATPTLQNIGGSVSISVEVTDLSLSDVTLNITYPNGSFVNTSLIGNNDGDIYSYEDSFTLDGVYTYYIWANDTHGQTAVSSMNTFEIADIEYPIISDIIANPTPQITGGNVNITCTVTDNINIDTVLLQITKPDTSIYEMPMNLITGDQYYFDTIYTDIGTYEFIITANDTTDNTVTTSMFIFNISTDGNPIITDNSMSSTDTGAEFIINISTTDADGIKQVTAEHWIDGQTHTIQQMVDIDGYWELPINIPIDDDSNLNYIIRAEDTFGFIEQTSTATVDIIDTIDPTITNDNTATTAGTGNDFEFNATVTDNIGINSVTATYWFGTGTAQTTSMTSDGTYYTATVQIPTESLDLLHYNITAVDTNANEDKTIDKQVSIIDDDNPVISTINANPHPQVSGGIVNITATITDNIQLDTVRLNVTNETGSTIVDTIMNTGTLDTFFYEQVYGNTGIYDYVIIANDSSNHQTISSVNQFNISNDAEPIITDNTESNLVTGENVTFNVTLTDLDTIDYAQVEYWFDTASHITTDLQYDGNNYVHEIIVPIDTSIVYYTITARDHYGFINTTETKQITITDIVEPSLTDNTLSTTGTGNTFTFNATVTDNIGVTEVIVSYQFGTGSITEESMNQITGTDYYEKQIIIPDSLEILHYNITAKDAANNQNNTDTTDVTITDDDAPTIENVDYVTGTNYVNVTCDVTDNIALNDIKLNLSNATINHNVTMIHLENNNYYYNISIDPGTYDYYIWAIDTSNNDQKTTTESIVIP